MRADRLLSILLLLQIHRRLTARELAERLEVSERTILRDMDALGSAGVPVTAERGVGGGWSLVEGYRTELTGLHEDEAQALALSIPPRLLSDLKLDRAAEGAILKLLAGLPALLRHRADEARRKIHVDVGGWASSPEAIPYLQIVQDAVWQERRLEILYGGRADRNDDAFQRFVDPLGLVAKGSAWYLAGQVGGDVRAYRISRIQAARMLDERCVRPEGFDLAAWWDQSSKDFRANLPRYPATLRVHPETVWRLPYGGRFARVEKVGEAEEDGWKKVEMRFQFEEEAAEFVLSFGPNVEVVDPPVLKERVLGLARSVLAFYGGRGEGGRARPDGDGPGSP
ncbi:MAG: YafY family protein [Acidobacteriota bacterium]